jgi:hypothetical protein
MQGMENFKIIDAQQARLSNNYENTKYKPLKTNAATWFSKICRNDQLTPKYVKFNIKDEQRNKNTKMAALKYRLDQGTTDLRETCIKNKELHLVGILN